MVSELELARHPMANRIGPLYDTDSLRRRLGVDVASIDTGVQRGAILEVTTSDGHRLYPAFQLDDGGQVLLPELPRVLAALDPRRVDSWGDATWLREIRAELGVRSPAQALRDGDADDVVALARQAGALFAP